MTTTSVHPTQVNVYVEQRSGLSDLAGLVFGLIRLYLYILAAIMVGCVTYVAATQAPWLFLLLAVPALALFQRIRVARARRRAQMVAYDRLRDAKAAYYRQWREEMEHNRV